MEEPGIAGKPLASVTKTLSENRSPRPARTEKGVCMEMVTRAARRTGNKPELMAYPPRARGRTEPAPEA